MVRITGDGSYATSPQAPGLSYGRPTLRELRGELDDVLAFHFDRPGPFAVLEHHERGHETAGRELVTRVALDEHRTDRRTVHVRLVRALAAPEQPRLLADGPTNAAGEVVYVCAMPSDTVGWLAEQLDLRGDAVTVAAALADPFVFTLPLVRKEGQPGDRLWLGSRRYPAEATIGQVMRDTPVVKPIAAQRVRAPRADGVMH